MFKMGGWLGSMLRQSLRVGALGGLLRAGLGVSLSCVAVAWGAGTPLMVFCLQSRRLMA
jgi:hypothetical protein